MLKMNIDLDNFNIKELEFLLHKNSCEEVAKITNAVSERIFIFGEECYTMADLGYPEYAVSERGRVYLDGERVHLYTHKNSNQYLVIYNCYNDDKIQKQFSVKKLVDRYFGKPKPKVKKAPKYNKSGIIMCNSSGEIVGEFKSMKEAQVNGYDRSQISKVIRGNKKHYKGYIWKYKEEL